MQVHQTAQNKVPAKIPRLAVYLPEEVYKRLEQEANEEERSLSQMAQILIREALSTRDQTSIKTQGGKS